jgi:hypothetical protein
MKRTIHAVIAALSLTLALAACAGGSSHSDCGIWKNGGGSCGQSGQ